MIRRETNGFGIHKENREAKQYVKYKNLQKSTILANSEREKANGITEGNTKQAHKEQMTEQVKTKLRQGFGSKKFATG